MVNRCLYFTTVYTITDVRSHVDFNMLTDVCLIEIELYLLTNVGVRFAFVYVCFLAYRT